MIHIFSAKIHLIEIHAYYSFKNFSCVAKDFYTHSNKPNLFTRLNSLGCGSFFTKCQRNTMGSLLLCDFWYIPRPPVETGLSPQGLTQCQQKSIHFQTQAYTSALHGLPCVTIQCVPLNSVKGRRTNKLFRVVSTKAWKCASVKFAVCMKLGIIYI